MIIAILANELEQKLNKAIVEAIADGNTILDNGRVTYRFLIHTDGGEYIDHEYINAQGLPVSEPTNKIVKYINCEFDTTGSQIDGVLSVEMSFSARLEILIPITNAGRKKQKMELVNTIRQIFDNTLRQNANGNIPDSDYSYGVVYQLAETSAREKRVEIGDSEILTAFLGYFIVQDGVNSANYELYIDGERVYFTRLGFNRGSTNESNVPSTTSNGAGKNIPSSSVFGLNFDMPTRRNSADNILMEYLFSGSNVAHMVELTRNFGENQYQNQYLMIFNEVSNNAEITKFASTSVSMVEADEVVPKSLYAQSNWEG